MISRTWCMTKSRLGWVIYIRICRAKMNYEPNFNREINLARVLCLLMLIRWGNSSCPTSKIDSWDPANLSTFIKSVATTIFSIILNVGLRVLLKRWRGVKMMFMERFRRGTARCSLMTMLIDKLRKLIPAPLWLYRKQAIMIKTTMVAPPIEMLAIWRSYLRGISRHETIRRL